MKRMRHVVFAVLAINIIGVTQRSIAEDKRFFTVQDSIEMTTFSDPDTRTPGAECKMSPDGRYFLVVTTKGILANNHIVSVLWLYSVDEVGRYLNGKIARAPEARQLLRIEETPIASQSNSYGSLVTKTRWSTDSLSILSLVEQKDGRHHLFQTFLRGPISNDLTEGDTDVRNFSEADGTIAYTVAEHMAPPEIVGHPLGKGSSDLTGVSLFQIFFPQTYPDLNSFWPPIDLWIRYKGLNKKVNSDGKWYFPTSAAGLEPAISPDGKKLIAAQPEPDIPTDWSHFRIPYSSSSFAPAHTGTDRSGRNFNWPWRYIYVDLDTMTVHPLVDAPSGFLEGYMDILHAAWSPDSQSVLFTNTYLPPRGSSNAQNGRGEPACAAAVYKVVAESTSCIANARFPDIKESLRYAAFGASSDQIILRWFGEGKEETETYAEGQRGSWTLEPKPTVPADRQNSVLRIDIRQDINEPPRLWASDPTTGLTKELWNPNPQLSSIQLGQATVYTWKDQTGYLWHAGLLLPPNFVQGHRYPLVIQTHGFYNEHEFLVDGSFTTGFAAQALAAAGIVVLQMEDRADRNVQPQDQESSLAVDGFESAIASLEKKGVIDTFRVGAIGFSRTAWYVEQALIHAPHIFRAATLIDGIDQSYMGYMLFDPGWSGAGESQEAANGGKPFGLGLQSWVKNAAGFNLDKVRAPVRIEALGLESVLGEREIYSSLYQQGKPVDLVYIPNAQHILQQPWQRYASQQGNVDWFRFWLQGYEDSDPAKRAQYDHWSKWKQAHGQPPSFLIK
jgi:dipeptidyl aminopeptidase/acylaminoacyl peptidase